MRALFPALLVCVLAFPAVASAVDYVTDPLTSATSPGRGGSRGGTFGADGWTVTAGSDTVWYEVPDALESGSILFTVSGLSTSTNLVGADHDILAVYQAPDGAGEPIAYSPYYRNNDMKIFARIFGTQETGRPGAVKLEYAVCVIGPPWYDNTCGAGCPGTDSFDYANDCTSGPGCVDWDPAKSYLFELWWGGGNIGLKRDGADFGTIDYASTTGSFSPQPMRVRIGSPRNGDDVAQSMPLGMKVRDVKISGTPGARTPVCGAQPPGPDAGAVVAPPDAGAPGSCDEHGAVADVTVASWEAGVFPDVNDLNIEADGSGNPAAVALLRFPALGGTATQATLRLRTSASGSAGGGSGQICLVASDTWTESATWASRPAWGACAGPERTVGADQEVEWDVASLLSGLSPSATVNLAVVSHDSDGAHFLSREGGGSALGPRLCAKVSAAVPPDAGTPVVPPDAAAVQPGDDAAQVVPGADAGQAVPGADGGTHPIGGDSSFPPGRDAGPATDVSGACGCGTGGQGLALAAALGALGFLVGRRRR